MKPDTLSTGDRVTIHGVCYVVKHVFLPFGFYAASAFGGPLRWFNFEEVDNGD